MSKPSFLSDIFFKRDSRYSVFDHVPEQRERWLKVGRFQFHGD